MSVQIIVITHGKAGESLIESSKMIIGESKNIFSFSLLPGMSIDKLMIDVKAHLDNTQNETLFMVDLYGGTPSNVALVLSGKYHACCVSGLNLGMLLEVIMQRDANPDISLKQLQNIALNAGSDACKKYDYESKERK